MYPRKQNHLSNAWVIAGAIALSFTAGFANAATLQVSALPVSHLTGSISRVSIEIAEGDYHEVPPFAVIVLGFFLGAMAAAVVISSKELGYGRRYAGMLLAEGVLFAIAGALALHGWSLLGLGTAAAACGLQNAMATSFHGMMVRTTHMTGLMTDLAFQVGRFFRSGKLDQDQFRIQVPTLFAFGVGGLVGVFAEIPLGSRALYIAAMLAGGIGATYLVIRPKLDRNSMLPPPNLQS